MSQPASATALCRVILALGRARATGILEVREQARNACVALADGKLAGLTVLGAPSRCLGEVLDDIGAWDCDAHGHAVQRGLPSSPVGAWLISEGISSTGAVADALERQIHERLSHVVMWNRSEYSFVPHLRGCQVALVEQPLAIRDAVWVAMSYLARTVPRWRIRAEVGLGRLRSTAEGAKFSAVRALSSDQALLFSRLRDGASVERLLSGMKEGDARMRDLWILKLLGLAVPASSGAYGLLLKKRRQLERAVAAHELLEVPERSNARQARRALRRLVRDLHPDRFGGGAANVVRRASNEVVSALIRAEAQLKGA